MIKALLLLSLSLSLGACRWDTDAPNRPRETVPNAMALASSTAG